MPISAIRNPIAIGFCLLSLLFSTTCRQTREPGARTSSEIGPPMFSDVAVEAGLDYHYFNGMTGEYYLCEIIGGGGALFDYDNDGDLDLFLAQGRMLGEGKTMQDALFPWPGDRPPEDKLFRNELTGQSASGSLRFTDVTGESGIEDSGYGMGAAAADFDNDGRVDLYVTNLGENRLFRNLGDGRFQDVTESAGAGDDRWSVSASFFDFDNDGWLDLYIGNYTDFTVATNQVCIANLRDYCNPLAYGAVPDRLLRNTGDGRFEDVSEQSGILRAYGRALGVAAVDLNGDGFTDVYVANDGTANQLWLNQGDGTFRDTALLAGCAVNETGVPEAGMGVDAGDFDGDGDEDLFLTHNRGETNTLYLNDGHAVFEDRTNFSGLGPPSQPNTGFGTAWLDYDNDGRPDLLAVNGAVTKVDALVLAKDPFPFHQKNQLFRNRGDGSFDHVSGQAGPAFQVSAVSRGALFGDLDNDGDTDAVIVNINAAAQLLRNEVGHQAPWLGLRLMDPDLNRDLIGTRVAVHLSDGSVLWRRVRNDGSYAGANDPRVLVGLGGKATLSHVRCYWPDGSVEEWREVPTHRYATLLRGRGERVALP